MAGRVAGFFRKTNRPAATHAAAAFFLGAATALGQAPWNLWPLALIALAVCFALFARESRAQTCAWLGWCFGTGYFGLALFWIVEPFLVDIARHGWMAPFALLFLAGGLALLWGLAFGLAARMRPRILALIVLLTATEMLRGVLFTGFPWAHLGHIWIASPVLQWAAFGGAPLLCFLALLIAALPSLMRPIWGSLAAVICVALALWGGVVLRGQDVLRGDPQKVVRLIQPNAAQHLKWQSDQVPIFFRRMLEMTRQEGAPDLIVWPETSVAYRLDRGEAAIEAMAKAANGVPLVFGVNDQKDGLYYNTMAVIGPSGDLSARYYKRHLVPFGEYIPFGGLLSQFGISGLAARDGAGYGAGDRSGYDGLSIQGFGKVLPLICYELIFPRNLRASSSKSAEPKSMILQITNDAWFGNYSGPYQHLAQARLRAVEFGLPVLRSANTGISAVIDAKGRVVEQTALNQAAVLDVALPPKRDQATFYAVWQDWPVGMFLGVSLFLLLTVRSGKAD
jgi:apolipoprotein N-acyltransferase